MDSLGHTWIGSVKEPGLGRYKGAMAAWCLSTRVRSCSFPSWIHFHVDTCGGSGYGHGPAM